MSDNKVLEISPEAFKVIEKMISDLSQYQCSESVQARVSQCVKDDGNGDVLVRDIVGEQLVLTQNVLSTVLNIMRLGGKVYKEDDRNLIGHSWITYGVNQSRHDGTWSINS